MNRDSIIAAAGAAAGWAATVTLSHFASAIAAFSTAAWMIAQTVILIRRQRCKVEACPHRLT